MNTRFLLIVFVLVIGSSHAYASDCPGYVDPEIITSPTFAETQYDHSVMVKDLRGLSLNGTMEENERNHRESESTHIGGLTHFYTAIANKGVINFIEEPDGSFCAQISKLNVDVNITDMVVYIANEFPVNSCSYDTVLGHELKHVAVAKELSETYQDQAKNYFQDSLRHLGVVHEWTKEDAEKHVNNAIKDYNEPFAKNLLEVFQENEKSVDSVEEYKRVGESCEGETTRIMRQAVYPH